MKIIVHKSFTYNRFCRIFCKYKQYKRTHVFQFLQEIQYQLILKPPNEKKSWWCRDLARRLDFILSSLKYMSCVLNVHFFLIACALPGPVLFVASVVTRSHYYLRRFWQHSSYSADEGEFNKDEKTRLYLLRSKLRAWGHIHLQQNSTEANQKQPVCDVHLFGKK